MSSQDNIRAVVGARLAIVRNDLALSQSAMAKALDLSLRGYINYESGARSLPMELLVRLNERFETDLNWLLLGARAVRIEHDLDALKAFQVELDEALSLRKLNIKSERRAAIVDRWYRSKLEGQEIDTDDLYNWIDLMAD